MIPFEISLGVTGHRNIEKTPGLNQAIEKALTEGIQKIINPKRRKYVTEINYKIITSLADGVDRIIASEAMRILNADMEAVLPMQIDEYKETFLSEESKTEFDKILNKSNNIKILSDRPLSENIGNTGTSDFKNSAYQKAGYYIVDNCDILITIYDGKKSDRKGGTYDTIFYALKKNKPIIYISSLSPHTLSYEKGEPFLKNSFVRFEFFNSRELSPEEQQKSTNEFYEEINFNPDKQDIFQKNFSYVNERLMPFYIRASGITARYKKLYERAGLTAFILSPLAVASNTLGFLIVKFDWLLSLIEFLLLSFILFIIYFADKSRAHKKWTQNRYLSEQLRTSIFLAICGIKPSPIRIPYNLRIAHKPDDWMVKVHNKALESLKDIPSYSDSDYKALLNFVKEHWIKYQLDYHNNKSTTYTFRSKIIERFGIFVFAIALISAGLQTFMSIGNFGDIYLNITLYMTYLAIVFPAIGTSLGAIRNHREYSRIIKRSENMAALLEELYEKTKKVNSMNELEIFLREVEEIMLYESQEWLMLMKFVKVEAV